MDADVFAKVEARRIDPEWRTLPTRGFTQELPESRHQVEPGSNHVAHGVDPEAAGRIEKVASVEERERTDLLRPDPAGLEHQLVFRGQPLDRHLGSGGQATPC